MGSAGGSDMHGSLQHRWRQWRAHQWERHSSLGGEDQQGHGLLEGTDGGTQVAGEGNVGRRPGAWGREGRKAGQRCGRL